MENTSDESEVFTFHEGCVGLEEIDDDEFHCSNCMSCPCSLVQIFRMWLYNLPKWVIWQLNKRLCYFFIEYTLLYYYLYSYLRCGYITLPGQYCYLQWFCLFLFITKRSMLRLSKIYFMSINVILYSLI